MWPWRCWLGQICADNELVRLRLLRQLPDLGNSDIPCEQAQRALTVRLSIAQTPNPNFRRVDARVFEADRFILQVSTVMGRQ